MKGKQACNCFAFCSGTLRSSSSLGCMSGTMMAPRREGCEMAPRYNQTSVGPSLPVF